MTRDGRRLLRSLLVVLAVISVCAWCGSCSSSDSLGPGQWSPAPDRLGWQSAEAAACIGRPPLVPLDSMRWRVVDGDRFEHHGDTVGGYADIPNRIGYVNRAALAANGDAFVHEWAHLAYLEYGHPWAIFGRCIR